MDVSEIPSIIVSLSSPEPGLQKMAVFRLQSSVSDPALADAFISEGGLTALRSLILTGTANTLAYSLQSFSKILEMDMGWEVFEVTGAGDLVERIVELICTHPLVNILRGAMSICSAVVSHPYSSRYSGQSKPGAFGFRAIKPAIAKYPQFYDMVALQLGSADHGLCGSAISLLNALMRDVLTNGEVGGEKDNDRVEDWMTFIKRLEDLGVMTKTSTLMRSSGLQDLAHPLLETQIIALMILRKRQQIPFDIDNHAQRRILKTIHAYSKPSTLEHQSTITSHSISSTTTSKASDPEKWRRLGFLTESPGKELSDPGCFAAIRDLHYYVCHHTSTFQRILLEQSAKPFNERPPIARCSLDVSWLLYDYFGCDNPEDASLYRVLDSDTPERFDQIFKPLVLDWARLHVACLTAFIRLWAATQASYDDYDKLVDLVKICIREVIGEAQRTDTIEEVEQRMSEISLWQLRALQLKAYDDAFEMRWHDHLTDVRSKLHAEASEFMKEQRIRCLMAGAWFPKTISGAKSMANGSDIMVYTYARLSLNRRYLHWHDFKLEEYNSLITKQQTEIKVTDLPSKILVNHISSVICTGILRSQLETGTTTNRTSDDVVHTGDTDENSDSSSASSASTIQPTLTRRSTAHTPGTAARSRKGTITKSMSNLRIERSNPRKKGKAKTLASPKCIIVRTRDSSIERTFLNLTCPTQDLACEWFDGLLLLCKMEAKTEETTTLVERIVEQGIKARLLHVSYVDDGVDEKRVEVPSREGVEDEYFYA